MENLIRNRALRIALSVAVLAVSVWAFLPYVTYRVASSAFVNAEIVRITAPMAGQLTRNLPRKGEYLESARSMNLVEALVPDRRQLVALEQSHTIARAKAELAQAQLREIVGADRGLAGRTERHRAAMLSRLGREIEQADADWSACLAEEDERRKQRTRVEQLAKAGVMSQRRVEEAQGAHESSFARCMAAEAKIRRLRTEVEAAKQGIFLQDGYNDAPYSQQQRDRLLLRRQELEAEVLRETARMTQIESEIAEERRRLDRMSHYELSMPANHVVWTLSASAGSAVVEGQTIIDLANCENRFAVVELPERDAEEIAAGDKVSVRLLGADSWTRGYVRQVRGSAARADERLLAAQVLNPGQRQITVEVALPDLPPAREESRYCDIGRLAEVRFQRAGFSLSGLFGRTADRLADLFGLGAARVAQRNDAIAN